MKPNILIAVTAYRERPTGATFKSVIRLVSEFHKLQISHTTIMVNYSDIGMTRNITASTIFSDPALTHVLFLDDDMSFNPSAIMKMIGAGKAVIGCICPRRTINLEKALNLAREGHSNNYAVANSVSFAMEMSAPFNGEPITPVDWIGMAVTLIRKDAIEQMRDAKCCNEYHRGDGENPVYGFFDRFRGLSEDVSFCKRWSEYCGGQVYAVTDEEIGHVGDFVFRSRYSDLMKL